MVAATILAVVPLLAGTTPAIAGGGCHSGVTTGRGDTVTMVEACFTPTTLYVEPGTKVTWVNEDPMTHNVTANDWGYFDGMQRGDVVRATFDEPGIYPYACTYHPGMSGAIVVGDGNGQGNGAAVTVESWQPPTGTGTDEASSAELTSTAGRDGSSAQPFAWIGGAIVGFAIAVAGGAVRSASRRTTRIRQP
jgi:plastocyanin